jgi:hypothetical protein
VISLTRDLYLTIHTTHKGRTTMPLVGYEPIIPASKRPQIYASVHAATGIGLLETTAEGNI